MRGCLQRRSVLLGATLALAELAWGCAPGAAGSSCNSDFDCGKGFFCGGSGVCQQSSIICRSFENCGENRICASGICVNGCRMDGCPSGQTCNRSLNQCVALEADEAGTSGGQGSSTSAGGSTSGTAGGTTGYGGSTTATTGSASSSGTTGTSSTGGSRGSTGSASASGGSSTGTTTGGGACTPDSWANFAGSFFTTYCNECHNWTQATVAHDPSVATEMRNGFMPPRRSKEPSPQDLNRILAWIGCGEP